MAHQRDPTRDLLREISRDVRGDLRGISGKFKKLGNKFQIEIKKMHYNMLKIYRSIEWYFRNVGTTSQFDSRSVLNAVYLFYLLTT